MSKERVMHGGLVTLTGECLLGLLDGVFDLPKDAVILKIVPTYRADYCFDILLTTKSKKYWEIAEGSHFPRKEKR